jgi:FKBP-type peptidyl-prolyl cis-trans isomerase 2
MWTYRDTTIGQTDVVGFEVEATDGSIGKVHEATYDVGESRIVVDTGPWIFGKKVLLPAGVIDRVDAANEKVFVALSKDEIKNAPEYDEDMGFSEDYRGTLGDYYSERVGATRHDRL